MEITEKRKNYRISCNSANLYGQAFYRDKNYSFPQEMLNFKYQEIHVYTTILLLLLYQWALLPCSILYILKPTQTVPKEDIVKASLSFEIRVRRM